jgi:hypothetical protein
MKKDFKIGEKVFGRGLSLLQFLQFSGLHEEQNFFRLGMLGDIQESQKSLKKSKVWVSDWEQVSHINNER